MMVINTRTLVSSSLAIAVTSLANAAATTPHAGTPITITAPARSTTEPRTTEVAMNLTSGRPRIPAMIGRDTRLDVVFDSGAQGAVVAKSLAERLGLEVIGETRVGSPAGGEPITAHIVSLGTLTVGNHRAENVPAVVLDDARLPRDVTLVVGAAQFEDARIELDFQNARFKLGTPATPPGTGWQPLNERGLTFGTLRIGSESVPVYVDSGNPGWIDLPKSLADRLPLAAPLKSVTPMKLVDRTIPRFAAPLDVAASIGDSELRLRGTFQFADIPFANIGGAALKQARLHIDVPSKQWRVTFAGTGPTVITPPEPSVAGG